MAGIWRDFAVAVITAFRRRDEQAIADAQSSDWPRRRSAGSSEPPTRRSDRNAGHRTATLQAVKMT
ncbi:hypothetical protein DDE19_29120 [Micromonospora ureilytica]|uniref:Uncharacterized protein n=1 Tax=Micromonospora ureilytica TaxID=709868 RepID=A0A3N9XGY3_9ACTN|nr:hypothetical protein DDE19_29120 [Micromonospora ureilytica]